MTYVCARDMALTPVRRWELAAVLALFVFVARPDAAAQARLPTPLSPYFRATAHARLFDHKTSDLIADYSYPVAIDVERGLYRAGVVTGHGISWNYPTIISRVDTNQSWLLAADSSCEVYSFDGIPFDASPFDGLARWLCSSCAGADAFKFKRTAEGGIYAATHVPLPVSPGWYTAEYRRADIAVDALGGTMTAMNVTGLGVETRSLRTLTIRYSNVSTLPIDNGAFARPNQCGACINCE